MNEDDFEISLIGFPAGDRMPTISQLLSPHDWTIEILGFKFGLIEYGIHIYPDPRPCRL
jgi:hypothetical protein